jgi:hypothetical protein
MTFPHIVCQLAVLILPSLSSDLLPLLGQFHLGHSNYIVYYEALTLTIELIGTNKYCWVVRSLSSNIQSTDHYCNSPAREDID